MAGLKEMSEISGISVQDIKEVCKAIRCQVGLNGRVVIQGFGCFCMKKKAARTGRNPKTGEVIHIPEKEVFSFKASAP